VAEGNFAQAVELVKLVAAEAVAGRNKDLVRWAKSNAQELQKKARMAADFATARQTLAVQPDDPAANLTAANYYCFLRGDWSSGLPYLVKAGESNLQVLAQRELATPPFGAPEAQIAMADAWWNAAQNADGAKRLAMLRHAGSWYVKAQGPALTGLNKIKIAKRMEELAKIESETTAATAGSHASIPINKWFSLLTSPNELTGWQLERCRYNYNNRIIELLGREMYCPIVAKDVAIRAKVRRQTGNRFRMLLRVSDEGCYYAQLDYHRWSIIKLKRNGMDASRNNFWLERQGEQEILGSVPIARNYGEAVFEMGFTATGNTLTLFLNRQALLQAKDATFTKGIVGIGTDDSWGLYVSDVEILIPSKSSLVADQRTTSTAAKP
jgi:hypothetical protein